MTQNNKHQKEENKIKLSQKEDNNIGIENKEKKKEESKIELNNKEPARRSPVRKDDLEGSSGEGGKATTVVVKGKKKKKSAPFLRGGRGQAHVKSSYNNTIVTITDLNGAVLIWSSAGKCGFRGPKKSTPYAAGVVIKSIADKVKDLGIKELDVFVRGVGSGREAAVRALDTNGLKVVSIKDVTPIPHGGCRPRKRRRV